MIKSLFKKVVGGLLIVSTFFSCSKDEITDDTASLSSEEQAFYIKKVIAEALSRNTRLITLAAKETTGRTNTKTCKLTIDEYCGNNINGEPICVTELDNIGTLNDENKIYGTTFYGLTNPYSSFINGDGTYVRTNFPDASFSPTQYIFKDANTGNYFYKYEAKAETNDILTITTTFAYWVWASEGDDLGNLVSNLSTDTTLKLGDVNIYLKDNKTDTTVAVIEKNTINPIDPIFLGFDWRVPSNLPSGEYYVEIESVEYPTLKTNKVFATKILIENNGEADETITELDACSVITSPEATYMGNLFTQGTDKIYIEWDKEAFTSDFVKITISIIDFFTFPFAYEVKFNKWVSNNGSYYIDPEKNYGTGTAILTIQSVSEGAGKSFSILN